MLESKKINLSIIGCSPADRIESFAKETNLDAKFIYSDPSLGLYKGLGLLHAKNFSEIKGKGEKAKESTSGFLRGMAWSICKSLRFKNGDVYQLGGVFIVNKENNVIFKKIDTSSEDHIGVEQLLKEVGV